MSVWSCFLCFVSDWGDWIAIPVNEVGREVSCPSLLAKRSRCSKSDKPFIDSSDVRAN